MVPFSKCNLCISNFLFPYYCHGEMGLFEFVMYIKGFWFAHLLDSLENENVVQSGNCNVRSGNFLANLILHQAFVDNLVGASEIVAGSCI